MVSLGTKPCRRRPKSGNKRRRWLLNPRLLRVVILLGVWAYRLWRLWRALNGIFGG